MKKFRLVILTFAVLGSFLSSCTGRRQGGNVSDSRDPKYLDIIERAGGGWTVVSVSPFDGSADTLVIDRPFDNLIVMSTSHVGFLDAIGRRDAVKGVSGPDYVWTGPPPSTPLHPRWELTGGTGPDGETTATLGTLRGGTVSGANGGAERSEAVEPQEPVPPVALEESGLPEPSDKRPADVGYDSAPDYETIVSLRPDVVLTYAVSGAESPFMTRLKQLGIKVFTVNEHLESHPLARAAYIRLFGALTGEMEAADSVLAAVRESYEEIAGRVAESDAPTRKVLLNIPYNDQWFVPSKDNYLTAMIHDAGGDVLGSRQGRAASSVMSVEKAYSLGKEADCWLNVGWCSTIDQLLGVNPVFADILGTIHANASERGFEQGPVVWNDNLRVNAAGGNDIWQSGVARPDLVLRDLVSILHPSKDNTETVYYKPIN